MSPLFSLYHIVKEKRKKTFRATGKNLRMPQIPSDGVPRLFNQTIPLLLEAAGVRYAMNVSKSTYRPSGLPAILTDGSVV
jgi:hypothetical protein